MEFNSEIDDFFEWEWITIYFHKAWHKFVGSDAGGGTMDLWRDTSGEDICRKGDWTRGKAVQYPENWDDKELKGTQWLETQWIFFQRQRFIELFRETNLTWVVKSSEKDPDPVKRSCPCGDSRRSCLDLWHEDNGDWARIDHAMLHAKGTSTWGEKLRPLNGYIMIKINKIVINGYMMVYDDKRVVAMNSPFFVVESSLQFCWQWFSLEESTAVSLLGMIDSIRIRITWIRSL